MYGYTGKLLRINLTTRAVSEMATNDYTQWGGGHGIGSAVFFDLVPDKTIGCYDPANVVTIMTSPLSGTLTPGCSSRSEVQGIGAQAYPYSWFTRSGFGGRFSSMLKFAGWDGVIIDGAADQPVWVDVRNDSVTIRNCSDLSLWGKDTWDCQATLWNYVRGTDATNAWSTPQTGSGGRTTQRPAVLAIGPAGENLSRSAVLIHDAACASGQGGFGAVWGSKKLKAISVIGTGSIPIYDPKALMKTRIDHVRKYANHTDNPISTSIPNNFQSPPGAGVVWEMIPGFKHTSGMRPSACIGCHSACKLRYADGLGNDAVCSDSAFYCLGAKSPDIAYRATDLLNTLGINSLEAYYCIGYVLELLKIGIIGPGTAIECPSFITLDNYGTYEFIEQFLKMLAYGDDGKGNPSQFGQDIEQGALRAAAKWGRLDEDLASGLLNYPYWGYPYHYDPRAQLEWGYGSILGDRDINEHCIYRLKYLGGGAFYGKNEAPITMGEAVNIILAKMAPFNDDELILDFSETNMYSEHMAKFVSWHRYYTRFWKQSMLFCDSRWPDFVNPYADDFVGSTGQAEPAYLKAVTGNDFSFEDGIELGKKIWNLDHAIWTLQGRHRDMVNFSEFYYTNTCKDAAKNYFGKVDGTWTYISAEGRTVDRVKFEEFKTAFYELQGWDTASGYPTRATLESLGMKDVADELSAKGKLGS
ncbi:MAG: aldehyde:ferredoxin oxidoreductase [Deltaproteobacteria bacterium]|nr:aldehyde:ferredoxin oxidoreductase [Deltaproteobacteria bacterium]